MPMGMTHLGLHKLMASTVLELCCGTSCLIGQWSISLGTACPCKIFLSSRIKKNSLNDLLVKAPHNAARKWLLLLSNSWNDRTLQHCWLITMIRSSTCFTSYPLISNQWFKPVVYSLPMHSSQIVSSLQISHWMFSILASWQFAQFEHFITPVVMITDSWHRLLRSEELTLKFYPGVLLKSFVNWSSSSNSS